MRVTTYSDVICPFCGCLCDDIEITVEENKVVKTKNSCAISNSKFMKNDWGRIISPTIDGKPVPYEKAIEEATKILSSAKRPLIYGLSKTDNEAIREAVHLSELVGGVIDSTTTVCHGTSIIAMQNTGVSTTTMGEVKNRADLIVFWGSNPAEAHPRHFQRYSVTPKGMYTPNGRKGRFIVVVDVRETRSSKMADQFIRINPNSDFDILQALRALVRGQKLSAEEVGGVRINILEELAERMKSAKVGCVFYGLGLNQSESRHMNVDALYSLVSDLNHHTKFVTEPMRGCFNVTGANMVTTWQTGYPFAVDFSRGYPRYNPGEYTAVDLLARKEVDAALIMGSDPASTFPLAASRYLSKIPVVTLERKETPTSMLSKVVIPVATSGIETSGTAYRMDQVPLKLRKVVDPPKGVFSDAIVLGHIIERIKALEVDSI
jgi:formylmethanofuran dehydrogenase subunit B